MKTKTVFAASLLLAGAAFADATTVDSSYVLGVMPVNASGKSQVILSIPWVAEGGGSDIAVTNLVKTAGLTAGDTLTWYNTEDGKYNQWIATSGSGGVLYWAPVTSVINNSMYAVPADDAALSQGQAVVLTRTATGEDLNKPIYVIGQVGASGSVTTAIEPAASESAPKYTLIAPPVASGAGFDLNSATFTGDIDEKDEITTDVVNGLSVKYVRNANGWRYVYEPDGKTATVPAGCGFWYKRCGAGLLSITWSAPSTSN